MAARRQQGQGNLMQRTRALLVASTMPYPDIFKATNIPDNWLYRFACDKVKDPGVNRVEALYTFLSGRPLEL